MLRHLSLLALSCALGGCASGAGPFRLDSAPSEAATRTAAARADLIRALRAGDWPTVESMLAPRARLRLPDGEEYAGRGPATAALRGVAPDRGGIRADFDLARTRVCTGALHDIGMLLVNDEAGAGAPLASWHVTVRWTATGAAGALEVQDLALYGASEFQVYRERPCEPVPDSMFYSRRFTAFIEPGSAALVSGRHADRLGDELDRTGWGVPLGEFDDPWGDGTTLFAVNSRDRDSRPIVAGAGVRASLAGPFYAAMHVGAGSGETRRSDAPARSRAHLDYRVLHGRLLAGFSYGWLHVAAGPAYQRVSGTWRTEAVFDASSPGPPLEWSSAAAGVAAEAGLLVPVTPRFGLNLSGFHRSFPDTEIPGYLGSADMTVPFTSWGVAAALALRL